ncbi:TlpA family protein disulfide reductase [Neolewinella aurantiaca]|nr:TlpA disulfide reductase family protein [Neolewinella aurantiaca]
MPGRKFFIPLVILALWFGGRAWYFTPNVGALDTAADFTAMRADGKTFSLHDLRGRYVLLDFWGSWCGPCRRESPDLVQLNQQTRDRLTIVSIAIERDSAAWQRAITKDHRNWPYQVMDQTNSFKFLSGNVASLYGIKQVPTNYLIDPEGIVIGLNLPLNQIVEKLK